MEVDPRRARLRREITGARGYFSDFHESLLRLSPDWLERYFEFVSAQTRTGLLSARERHLIYIALDASVTHLYPRGIEIHSLFALREGATAEEIFEVLQLACEIGGVSCEIGVAVLRDELLRAGRGSELAGPVPDAAMQALKQDFVATLGHWPDWLDTALLLSPDYAAAFMRLALAPWQPGVLSPRLKEFIYVAHYAAPTVRHEPGIRTHIRRSLALGATAAELMEVLQLASSINMHSCSVGAPVLTRVMDAPADELGARYGIPPGRH
jgi:alkylhydroperoxidase/carboxymuconolactone decarboxylase family protein YurZ